MPATELAIRARPLIRSSVMRRTLDVEPGGVNMRSRDSSRNRTKRRAMSGNFPASPRKMDSRERRTRDALGDALVELMHQKPFPSITVQNVLDRAGVA